MDIDDIASFIGTGSITSATREHLEQLGVMEDETWEAADPRRWARPRHGHCSAIVWIGSHSEPTAAIRYCRVLPRMADTREGIPTWYYISDYATADSRRRPQAAESAVQRLCSVLQVLWGAGTMDRLTADAKKFRSILSWKPDDDIGDLVCDGGGRKPGSILHQYTTKPAAE
jgi:hypothetical protein